MKDLAFKFPDSKILVFCKAPVFGTVKTRLLSVLSKKQATEFHIRLATQTINQAIKSQLCPVEIWCSPNIDHPFFQAFEAGLKQQKGKDLGERMHHALQTTLTQCSSAILIGTDCPSMTIDDLDQAFTKLEEGSDIVIAPAEDGGYTLIGLKKIQGKKKVRSIFKNIDWGTSKVFDQTISKINKLDLYCYKLSMQWDVDRPEDFRRYVDSQKNNH